MKPPRRFVTTVVWLALGAVASAAPSGLNVIPTTDLVPNRHLSVQLSNGNTEVDGRGSVFHQPQLLPQFELGLPGDVELGLDVAPSNPPRDYRPQMNIKWTPLAEDTWWPAVGAGAQSLGLGFAPSFFLVTSKTLNFDAIQYQKFRAHHRNIKLRGIRLHAGILRTPNAWRAMVGTDVELGDHFVLYADWVSGPSDAVSLGGVVVLGEHDSITAALLRGNDQDRISGVVVSLTHTFSW